MWGIFNILGGLVLISVGFRFVSVAIRSVNTILDRGEDWLDEKCRTGKLFKNKKKGGEDE